MRFPLIVMGIVALLAVLFWQFPYAVASTEQKMRIVYLVAIITLIAAGSGSIKRVNAPQMVRDILLWLGIILLLVFGYSLRHDVAGSRMFAELVPARIQTGPQGEVRIRAAEDGHFHIEAEVNGALLRFMIDTGATDIVLSPRDAIAAGFKVSDLHYSRIYHTANGSVKGAPVMLKTLIIGPIALRDVSASVNGAEMDQSLLGMAFLKQFSRYSVEQDTLTLYP